MNYSLWYEQPASDWNEALPLGNGRLGMMVFGLPGFEKLQINELSKNTTFRLSLLETEQEARKKALKKPAP